MPNVKKRSGGGRKRGDTKAPSSVVSHRKAVGEFHRKIQERVNEPDIELALKHMGSRGLRFSSASGKLIGALLFLSVGVQLIESVGALKFDDEGVFDKDKFKDHLKDSFDPAISKRDRSLIMKSANSNSLSLRDKKLLSVCLESVKNGTRNGIVVQDSGIEDVTARFHTAFGRNGEIDGYLAVDSDRTKQFGRDMDVDPRATLARGLKHESTHCVHGMGIGRNNLKDGIHSPSEIDGKILASYLFSLKNPEQTQKCVDQYQGFKDRLGNVVASANLADSNPKWSKYFVSLGKATNKHWKDVKFFVGSKNVQAIQSYLDRDLSIYSRADQEGVFKFIGKTMAAGVLRKFKLFDKSIGEQLICPESIAHLGELPRAFTRALDSRMGKFISKTKAMIFNGAYENLDADGKAVLDDIYPKTSPKIKKNAKSYKKVKPNTRTGRDEL